MTQLQDAQKGAEVTSEATERELELEAQLVEARSIIQEQVLKSFKHLSFLLTFSRKQRTESSPHTISVFCFLDGLPVCFPVPLSQYIILFLFN